MEGTKETVYFRHSRTDAHMNLQSEGGSLYQVDAGPARWDLSDKRRKKICALVSNQKFIAK